MRSVRLPPRSGRVVRSIRGLSAALQSALAPLALLASLVGSSAPAGAQPLSRFDVPLPVDPRAELDAGADMTPRVATDGAGGWLAVWSSTDSRGGTLGEDADILVSRSLDAGESWEAPVALDVRAGSDTAEDEYPRLAADARGVWIVVWESQDPAGGALGPDRDLLFARSSDGGVTWSAPLPLHANAASDVGDDFAPDVATDGLGGWVVVWSSTDPLGDAIGDDADILVVRSLDDGVTWSDPAPLDAAAGLGDRPDGLPRLATDGQGIWVVVWESKEDVEDEIDTDFDVLFARSEDVGASWSPGAPLNPGASDDSKVKDRSPVIATDRRGLWLVVWARRDERRSRQGDDAKDLDLWSTRSEDGGRTWRGTQRVHPNSRREDRAPELATDGQGVWVVVWHGKGSRGGGLFGGSSDDDIRLARSATAGESWTKPAALNSNADQDLGNDTLAHVAADEQGNWVAVWQSNATLLGTIGPDLDILSAVEDGAHTDIQRKCAADLAGSTAALARGRQKAALRCARVAADDPGVSLASCTEARPVREKKLRSCSGIDAGGVGALPPFGSAPREVARDAALAGPLRLLEDLLGPAPDAALLGGRQPGARCQAAVLKGGFDAANALWKSVLVAKPSVLAGRGLDGRFVGPPGRAEELAASLLAWLEADPRGKRAKLAARLPSRVAKACASRKSASPVALETLFPGRCAVAAESGADALSACVLERVSCRFCQQLAGTDELALDCDLFDDRSMNGSCAPELP